MKSSTSTTDTVSITKSRTRYVRDDGMVGVIYSPDFGGGFSTWGKSEMAVDPVIVEWVLQMEQHRPDTPAFTALEATIQKYVEKTYDVWWNGGRGSVLNIRWLPAGTKFIINEYDGSETICCSNELDWIVA